MNGQKGGFLDKIRAFFIRRKEAKRKKRELERKELQEILDNISKKVQPIGTIINIHPAAEKIDLKKISLIEEKKEIHIVKDEKIDNNQKEQTKDEMLDDVFDLDDMDIKDLKQLKSNIVESDNKREKEVTVEDRIIDEYNNKNITKSDINKEEIISNTNIDNKAIENKEENKIKNNDDNSKKQVLFVTNKKLEIDKNKSKDKNIIFKDLSLFNIFQSKEKKKKSSEEEMSLVLIRIIDKNLYELDYLKKELDYLSESNKRAKTKEELFELEQRFLILKERLECAYQEFIKLRDSKVISDNIDISKYNEEFSMLIQKYKLEIYDNDIIKQTLIDIENQYKTNLNVIESIVVLEESKEVINDEVSKGKSDIYVGNDELSLTSDTIQKIEYMKEELSKNLNYTKEIVDSELYKINTIKPEEKVNYHYHIIRNLIKSAINFSFSYAMLNPRRGRLSNILGAATMLNGIRILSHAFEPEKEIHYIASDDFENEIKEHLNDFSYVKKNIDLSIEEIANIKYTFKEKFSSLANKNPEVNNTLKIINNLEEQLKDIRIEMILQESKLNETLTKNNQIVKKIEEN